MIHNKPKIYTGGVDISQWSKLKSSEKKAALSKPWYVYYSFRNPKTNELKRQPNIKGGANLYSTRKERLTILNQLQKALEFVLERGYNPYEDNTELGSTIEDYMAIGDSFQFKSRRESAPENLPEKVEKQSKEEVEVEPEVETSIAEAFDKTMQLKERVLKANSYSRYKSRINQFRTWLTQTKKYKETQDISTITKKTVIEYLNAMLMRSSARNRNNSRTDIASLFQVMYDNDIIAENFVKQISVLKSIPERNKTYKAEMVNTIMSHLEKKDEVLLLFVQFISYGFLRPIEICRLKVGDIEIEKSLMYIRAKNKPVKIKIIPEILKNMIPDLSNVDKELSLITPEGLCQTWDISDDNKRDFFSKRYKKVKDELNIGENYGLYSFRHTFVTKIYKSLRKDKTPFEAKSALMEITGHNTMQALEKYLRDIDAELPEDFSSHFK